MKELYFQKIQLKNTKNAAKAKQTLKNLKTLCFSSNIWLNYLNKRVFFLKRPRDEIMWWKSYKCESFLSYKARRGMWV